MNKKILTLSILCLSLISCNKVNYEYEDFSEHQIEIKDIYSFKGEYIVYCYGPWCPHCTEIKQDVLSYVASLDNGGKHNYDAFYMIPFEKYDTEIGATQRAYFKHKPTNYNSDELVKEMKENQPSSIEDTYIISFPSMYIIKDGVFEDYVVGSVNIPEFLNNN